MNRDGRPQLTRRGRGVLLAAAGLVVAARLFGSVELAGLGAAAAASVAVAAVLVGRAPATYRAERWLAPMRVGMGEAAEVRWRFTNTGGEPTTGTVVATDPCAATPGGQAGCLVPALAPGAMAEATSALPTGRRGAIPIGPLAIGIGDPLGLAERRREMAGTARLVVHPRIHTVLALPASSTRETRHGSTHPARSPQGDDFFALREYVVGDDLRRVHWRSTARLGDLMLRQDELRFGEMATVLLDTRASAHPGDSFERALEVAASVAAAFVEAGRHLRFVTTGGFDIELDVGRTGGSGRQSERKWGAILDHLAEVTLDSSGGTGGARSTAATSAAKDGADRFAFAVQSIRRNPSGPLAAVVGDATPAELSALGALRPRLGLVLIAQIELPAAEAGQPRSVPGALVVPVHHIHDFPEAWNQAVLSCGRRDVVSR